MGGEEENPHKLFLFCVTDLQCKWTDSSFSGMEGPTPHTENTGLGYWSFLIYWVETVTWTKLGIRGLVLIMLSSYIYPKNTIEILMRSSSFIFLLTQSMHLKSVVFKYNESRQLTTLATSNCWLLLFLSLFTSLTLLILFLHCHDMDVSSYLPWNCSRAFVVKACSQGPKTM